MNQVVIVVSGGAVQAAYTDVDDLDVLVADHDEYEALGMGWKQREASEAEVSKGLDACQWGMDTPEQDDP